MTVFIVSFKIDNMSIYTPNSRYSMKFLIYIYNCFWHFHILYLILLAYYICNLFFALCRYNLTLAHGVKLSIVQRCHTCSVYSFCKYTLMLVFYVHVTYYLQYVATRLPSSFRLLFLYIRTLYSGGFPRNENPAACLFYSYYDPCSTPHSPSPSTSIATCYYDTRLRSTHTYTHVYIIQLQRPIRNEPPSKFAECFIFVRTWRIYISYKCQYDNACRTTFAQM